MYHLWLKPKFFTCKTKQNWPLCSAYPTFFSSFAFTQQQTHDRTILRICICETIWLSFIICSCINFQFLKEAIKFGAQTISLFTQFNNLYSRLVFYSIEWFWMTYVIRDSQKLNDKYNFWQSSLTLANRSTHKTAQKILSNIFIFGLSFLILILSFFSCIIFIQWIS